jgi:DNA polymerase elongation subunit (family B)
MLVRGYDEYGQPFMEKHQYSPTLFVPTNKETGYKDIHGVFQLPMNFPNMYEATTFLRDTKTVSNGVVNGMDNFNLAFIADMFGKQVPNTKLVRIKNIDIEVHSATYTDPNDPSTARPDGFPEPEIARWEIDSMTLYDNIDDEYTVYSTRRWSKAESTLKAELLKKVKYKFFATEKEMLIAFIQDWRECFPDIVTGWYSNSFDIPYIHKRISLVLGEAAADSLSPYGRTDIKTMQDNQNGQRQFIKFVGIAQLDYIELYKKFVLEPRSNFRLGYIAKVEIEDDKLDFEGSLVDLAIQDPQRYVDYNIYDVDLVKRINEKLLLIDLMMYMTYDAGMTFEDGFSPIKQWDSIIFNHLRKEKIVVPMKRNASAVHFEGGFVKDPLVGYFRWIMSFDLESLYPGIIRQGNISPDTIVDVKYNADVEDYVAGRVNLAGEQYSVCANGTRYRRDIRGVIPTVVEHVFNQRKTFKNMMKDAKKAGNDADVRKYDLLQKAAKIAINSCYGALGNAYFRYYDVRNAEAVTATGRVIIKWAANHFNGMLNQLVGGKPKDRVIAIDTDSCYVSFEDLVDKFYAGKTTDQTVTMLDRFAEEKVQPLLNKWYAELAKYMNHYSSVMYMKREAISSTGFFVAKKRYALAVWDMEGYRYKDAPDIKIAGIETQRASTPQLARDGLKEAIDLILDGKKTQLMDLVSKVHSQYQTVDYREIAGVSSANNLAKYTTGDMQPGFKCPGHIKGVLAFNRAARKFDSVDMIKEGEKIASIMLRVPNSFGCERFAFKSGMKIPAELNPDNVLRFMDRELMYDKSFIKPLATICDAIGWKYKDEISLEDFM